MSGQPEAVRLAELLEDEAGVDGYVHDEAAAELRRQHAALVEMQAALKECELFIRVLGLDSEPAAKTAEIARATLNKPENQP